MASLCLVFLHGAIPALCHWLFVFICFSLVKLAGEFVVYRVLVRHDNAINYTTMTARYGSFLIDTIWIIWFVYGNVIYYLPNGVPNESN